MGVKNLMLFIHRGQKSLKTQYEIIIFASKFHLGASWCPPGRVGAPWAYFGLQDCLKMGVFGLSWVPISFNMAQEVFHKAPKLAQKVTWGAS